MVCYTNKIKLNDKFDMFFCSDNIIIQSIFFFLMKHIFNDNIFSKNAFLLQEFKNKTSHVFPIKRFALVFAK